MENSRGKWTEEDSEAILRKRFPSNFAGICEGCSGARSLGAWRIGDPKVWASHRSFAGNNSPDPKSENRKPRLEAFSGTKGEKQFANIF